MQITFLYSDDDARTTVVDAAHVPSEGETIELDGTPHRVKRVVFSYWTQQSDTMTATVYVEPGSLGGQAVFY